MSTDPQKPDDVPLDQVHREFKTLQLEKKNEPILKVLADIKSSVVDLVNQRFDRLELDVEGRFSKMEDELKSIRDILSSSEVHAKSTNQAPSQAHNASTPQQVLPNIFFEIKLGSYPSKRIVLKLWDDIAPTLCKNARKLIKRSVNGYQGSHVAAGANTIEIGVTLDDRESSLFETAVDKYPGFAVEQVAATYDAKGLVGPRFMSQNGGLAGSGFVIVRRAMPGWDDRSKYPGPFGEVVSGLELFDGSPSSSGLARNMVAPGFVANCGFVDA